MRSLALRGSLTIPVPFPTAQTRAALGMVVSGDEGAPFLGALEGPDFSVRRIKAHRSAFLPYMRGRIAEGRGGVLLEITLRPHRQVVFFLSIWITFLLLAAVLLSLGEWKVPYLLPSIPLLLALTTWLLSVKVFESDCRWASLALLEALAGAAVPGLTIRPESPGDEEAIRRVNTEAFGGPSEAELVDALRRAGDLSVSLVALENGEVVGHVAFSPLHLEGAAGGEALGLAPLAVLEGHRRRGIGARLVLAGIEECRRRDGALLFVLGHPGYYPRFGFLPASDHGLRWEHEAPPEAFMVLELVPGALRRSKGVVRFGPQFEGPP